MAYQALYRKFRPADFDSVKGQDHIVETLKNQIKAQRIGHAYLFCGTRGTGKTTIAKIFAKGLNCLSPVDGSPCCQCENCLSIASGTNLNVIEMDAASNNGVDAIRDLIDSVSFLPIGAKYKVYIIDEAHMITTQAFNALLKTLEEPPAHAVFILATTEANKLPITILSRCQRYDFKRIGMDTITARMAELMEAEGQEVEERALRYIAKMADGSLRDALSLLDQCIAFHLGQKLTYDMALDVLGAVDTQVYSRLVRSMVELDVVSCIGILDDVVMQGRELPQFVVDYVWYLRNLLLVKSCDKVEEVIDVSSDNLQLLKEEADMLQEPTIMRYIRLFSDLSNKLRHATNVRIQVEMALIRCCKPEMETDQDSVLDRIRALEKKMEQGPSLDPKLMAAFQQMPAQAAPERKKRQLERALPEDIKKARQKWPNFVEDLESPLSQYLKEARLSINDADELEVYVPDNTIGTMVTKSQDNQALIQNSLNELMQKEVPLRFKTYQSKEDFPYEHVDLTDFINMPIEEED